MLTKVSGCFCEMGFSLFSSLVPNVIIGYSLPLSLLAYFPTSSSSFSFDMLCVIFINSSLLTSDVMMAEVILVQYTQDNVSFPAASYSPSYWLPFKKLCSNIVFSITKYLEHKSLVLMTVITFLTSNSGQRPGNYSSLTWAESCS